MLAVALPLVADEAYYLSWSRDLRLGYLDHPPGVAAWIALGGGHPRLVGLVLMPAAWWLLADAARRWGVAGAAWLPALAMATPLGLASGLIATPDQPLVFAWCVLLWCLARGWLVGVGLALGACFWAKSTALVALPGLCWVLGRRAPRVLAVAAATYAPHVLWSLYHEGLPWSFQARRGLTGFHLPEAIGGQLLVATPGLALLAIAAWRRPRDATDRLLRALGLPVLAAWMLVSCGTRVEANWPCLAWPATLVLLLRHGHRRLPAAAALAAALTVGAAVIAPILDRAFPDRGPPRDGARLAACLSAARLPSPVAARYQEKALLDAAGHATPYLAARHHRPSEYDRVLVGPSAPACGFVYLADLASLGDRCAGPVEMVSACGRHVARCDCGTGKP